MVESQAPESTPLSDSLAHQMQQSNKAKNSKSDFYPKAFKPLKGLKQADTIKEELRLYSISEDNYLMEYNIEKSKEILVVENFVKIENQYNPLSLLEYREEGVAGSSLLISNSGYKLKIWRESEKPEDGLQCVKTQLGPVYGSPITQMEELDLRKQVYFDNGIVKGNSLN